MIVFIRKGKKRQEKSLNDFHLLLDSHRIIALILLIDHCIW